MDPFEEYCRVLEKKGYFKGTEPGSEEYNTRLEKARVKWEENLEKKKTTALERKEQGNLKFKEGDYDTSISLYSEAIKYDPSNPQFFSNRGLAYFKLRKYDQAIQDYNTSLSLDDTQVKIYIRLGNTLTQVGKQQEAIEIYRKGLVVDPSNEDLLNNLRVILEENVPEQPQNTQGQIPDGLENMVPPGFNMEVSISLSTTNQPGNDE